MKNPFTALFQSASAIASSNDLLNYLQAGTQSLAGTTVSENTALNLPPVMTAVAIRSRTLASLPCKVYERIDDRSKQPARDHSLSRVLLKPNSWQTRSMLFGMLEAHRVLRGNAYCWINWVDNPMGAPGDQRQVRELVPLHPDRMEVEQPTDLGGPVLYTLHRKNGQTLRLPQSEVLHLRGFSTDGLKGRSVLADAKDMIGGALAAQEHANTTWKKGGLPAVALRHPKNLSEKARKNLEESFEATYGGGKDKRRVAVVEEGMEITPLTPTSQEMQFLDSRKFSYVEIGGWFFVPPFMLGYTEKQTSWGTGIEQQQIGFVVFTARPDLVTWEQEFTLNLLEDPTRFFVEFSLDGLMRGDATARSNYYWRMVQMGAFSPNDVREKENMNPIEGGDIYLQPTNMMPLGADPPGSNPSGAGPNDGTNSPGAASA